MAMENYTTTGASRTLSAMFDSRAEADRAVAALRDAGIADVVLHGEENEGYGTRSYDASADRTARTDDRGFFESIGDFFFPEEDRYAYAEGLNRGGYVVSVEAMDGEMDTVIDILDVEGSVDMDSRSDEWSASGWERPASNYDTGAGYQPGMTGSVETDG